MQYLYQVRAKAPQIRSGLLQQSPASGAWIHQPIRLDLIINLLHANCRFDLQGEASDLPPPECSPAGDFYQSENHTGR